MKGKIVVFGVIIVLCTIAFAYFYVFKESKTDISNEKAEFKLSAIELFYKFEEDENQANKLYLGKIIEVTGTIVSIQKTQNNDLMLMFREDDEIFGVACTLKINKTGNKNLNVGKKIALKGVCQGYLTDVILNNCVVVKSY